MSILILKRLVNRYNYYYSRVGRYSSEEMEMEKNIIEKSDYNGYISVEDLTSIIDGEPNYPYHKVGSTTLKKVFMKSLYQIER